MKLVIDIPKEKYEAIKDKYDTFPAEWKEWGLEAIRNGSPFHRETEKARADMNYKDFTLGDWIGHISGAIEDETTLDRNEMRDLVEFLTKMQEQKANWVPVSSRLPEDNTKVIVSRDDTYRERVIMTVYQDKEHGFLCGLVTAWMPLEPYEESEV